MGKLVYVAGPIGESTDARERFREGTLEVAQLGYQPVSPLELCGGTIHVNACHSWREHMVMDIRALLACEGIYLLRGWENSRGARLEKLIADGLEMFVLYQDKVDRLAAGFDAGPRTFDRVHEGERDGDN